MSWRPPKGPDEAVEATCENLRELADAYHPFVAFTELERFFPILAEMWLTHSTHAEWPAGRKRGSDDDRPTDPFRRGTGICTADPEVRNVRVVGGTPNVDDRPIQLTDDPSDPDAIGSYAGRDGGSEVFLDVGGWADRGSDTFQGLGGDLGYLADLCSELAGAMNADLPWVPAELRTHLPQCWITQPPTPTTYCEARWAYDFADGGDGGSGVDFPPGASDAIGDVLVLTYHYLFPAREPSEGEPAVRPLEGQWEAISIYFRGRPSKSEEPGVFFEPPIAVVAGQGSDAPGPIPFASEARRWADVTTASSASCHPILLASRGTHRFFFAPTSGVPWTPGGPDAPANDNGSYDNNSEFPGWESVLIGGLAVAGLIAAFGGPVGWVVGAVIAILVILFWLISLIVDLCNDTAENPANPFPSNPEAGGEGPWAGDDDEPPVPGSGGGEGEPPAGGGGGGGDGWGLPNSGSPTGANTISFDVRFVDRTRSPDGRRVTGYPSAEPCEQPSWWDFPGQWGVRVPSTASGTWASGQRRVDAEGRCRGYWNTLRFLRDIALGGA